VCKFYQGAEDKELEAQLKKMFGSVHREKPESSRSVGVLWRCCFALLMTSRNRKRLTLWH
jgi:hypothetical protein